MATTTDRTTDPAIDSLSFDDALAELQRTVAELEAGGQPLEAAIALYERGVALQARCEKLLGMPSCGSSSWWPGPVARSRRATSGPRTRPRSLRRARRAAPNAQPGATFRLNRNRFSGS